MSKNLEANQVDLAKSQTRKAICLQLVSSSLLSLSLYYLSPTYAYFFLNLPPHSLQILLAAVLKSLGLHSSLIQLFVHCCLTLPVMYGLGTVWGVDGLWAGLCIGNCVLVILYTVFVC